MAWTVTGLSRFSYLNKSDISSTEFFQQKTKSFNWVVIKHIVELGDR